MKKRVTVKKLIFLFLITILLFGFIGEDNNKITANTPTGIYNRLRTHVEEVLPGDYVDVTISFHNVSIIPPQDEGIGLFMLYMYFDADKFELPIQGESNDAVTIADEAIIRGPKAIEDGVKVSDIICKIMKDNPNYITIEYLYWDSSDKYFNLDGDILTLRFQVKDGASGTGEFYMTEDDAGIHSVVYTGSFEDISVDNTVSYTYVIITSEPTSQFSIDFVSNGGTYVESIKDKYNAPISAPTPPIKEGYVFENWYTSSDGGTTLSETPYIFNTMPNMDLTLYAKWTPIEYEIKFDSNGGVGSMESLNVSYGENIILTNNAYSKAGHTFKGWSTTLNGPVVYNDGQRVSNLRSTQGITTLYAVWEKNPFKLLFNDTYLKVTRNGEELSNGSNIFIDDILTITYIRNGYDSATILANEVELINSTYTVGVGDVTLKVTDETPNTYSITYNTNGGINDSLNPPSYTIISPKIIFLEPTRDGYHFVGWFDSESGGSKVQYINSGSTGDVILYARWLEKLIVTLDFNDGETFPSSFTVVEGNKYGVDLITPTRTGYIFEGWYTQKDGGIKKEQSDVVDSSHTLYARWGNVPYTLNINSTYLTVMRGTDVLKNGSEIYKDDILTISYCRNGYDRATILANGVTMTSDTYTVGTQNVTLSIDDEVASTYSITYILYNGINHSDNPHEYTINTPTIALQSPTREGYQFVGWFDSESGGSKVEYINIGSTGEKVLHARWQKELIITLDPNGGAINDNAEPHVFTALAGEMYGSNLLTPVRVGYHFTGWYTSAIGGTEVKSTDQIVAEQTLYAQWEAKSVNIIFNSNGGTTVSNITKKFGEAVDSPTNPTKIGHTFAGWYRDNNTFNEKVDFPFNMPDEGMTLYAKWTVNQYRISFESNGGSDVEGIVKNYGETITKPLDPTRDGYVFAGWYTDNNTFLNPYTFTTMKDQNIILYAKWLAVYTITFEYEDGVTGTTTKTVNENEQYGVLPEPTRTGYVFGGWWTEQDGKGELIIPTKTVNINANQILYAKWTANLYTITFHPNGGDPVTKITELYNQPISEPKIPTKSGYRFAGWYLDNNTFKQLYTFPDLMPAENLSLYAKWEARNDISIVFIENGGIEVSDLTNLVYLSTFTFPTTTRVGYKFLGWYLDEELTNEFTSNIVPADSIVLYAKWIREFIITIEYNNGNPQTILTKYEGDTYGALPTPTKIGYTFNGWYSTNEFQTSTKVSNNDIVSDSVTLYANWSKNTYTITYNSQGGSQVEGSPFTYLFDTPITEPPAPNKDGYHFGGWFTDPDGTVEFIFSTMPAENLNLYAKWVDETSIPYEINLYNFNNEGIIHTITRYGGETFSFPNTSVSGYTFVGWFTTSDFQDGTMVLSSDTVTGENTTINLYAKWAIKQVTMTFMSAGNKYFEIIQDYNTSVTAPVNPTRTGYTFVGWFINLTNSNPYVFDKMPGDDLILYAKWTPNTYTITFNSMGGSPISSITREYGTTGIALSQPTKEGYIFKGWYDNEQYNGSAYSSPFTMGEDITLYAKWEIEGYDDNSLKEIIITTLDGDTIKRISNINDNMEIYIPNQFAEVIVKALPTYTGSIVSEDQTLSLIETIPGMIHIIVTAQSGDSKIYTLSVIRDTAAELTNIELDQGININFDGTSVYTVNVGKDISKVNVIAITNDEANEISINGQKVSINDLHGSLMINLNAAGSRTDIKIIVYSYSKEESKEYMIYINRSSASSETTLTGLTVRGGLEIGTMYQMSSGEVGYNPSETQYKVTFPYSVSSVTVHPVYPIGARGTITGNGNLVVGENLVKIIVTAADGLATKEYTIIVTRQAPSNSAALVSVAIKNIDTNQTNFQTPLVLGIVNTIKVPYSYQRVSLVLEKSPESNNAVISDLGTLALKEGTNNYTLIVTAEDEVTTREYQIQIIREEGNTDRFLKELTIDGYSLTPNLDLGNIYNYRLLNNIPYNVNQLILNVEKESPAFGYITIKYNNQEPVKAKTLSITPVIGESVIEIKVYPEKGESLTYQVIIEKDNIPGNSELSSLIVRDKNRQNLSLTPEFNMQVIDYNVQDVKYKIDQLFIKATSVDGASITAFKVNGIDCQVISGEYNVLLNVGVNTIIITATSNINPAYSTEYTIRVNRLKGDTVNTAKIISTIGKMTHEGNIYSLIVPNSTTAFKLEVIKDSIDSIVKINGEVVDSKTFDFSTINHGSYTVEVTSEMGEVNTYTVNVTRSDKSEDASIITLFVTGSSSLTKVPITIFPANITLPYMDSFVEFDAQFSQTGASIAPISQNLAVGLNTISIIATAPDGLSTKEYIVNITRESPSSNSLLENIILNGSEDGSIQYPLVENFEPNLNSYNAQVPYKVNKLVINPVVLPGLSSTYKIYNNGQMVDKVVELAEGDNNFEIVVTAEDGSENFYFININRAYGNNDATLVVLSITDREIGFNKDIYTYPLSGYISYGYEYDVIRIYAKATSKTSKINLKIGSEVISFADELNYQHSLKVGITEVKVIVISENNTEKTYNINIQKTTSSSEVDIYGVIVKGIDKDNNLSIENFDLYDSNGNKISFERNVTTYYTSLPYKYKNTQFFPQVINSNVEASDLTYQIVEGLYTPMQFKIISEDGFNFKTYTIYVYGEPGDSNANLSFLQIYDLNNTPYITDFNPELLAYAFQMPKSAQTVKVIAKAASEKSTLIVGDKSMNPYDANDIRIHNDMDIYVWVIPETGTPKAYIIRIEKTLKSNNPHLSSIIITDGNGNVLNEKLSANFKFDILSYHMIVDYSVDEIFIAGIGIDGAKIIHGAHTSNIKTLPTENIIELVCEAEDFTTVTYTFVVYRLLPSRNADLEYIEVNDQKIEIKSNIKDYHLDFPYSTDSVLINPFTKFNVDSIKVNGIFYTKNTPMSFELETGLNQFEIVVMAEDQDSTSVYTLTINRQSPNNKAIIEDMIIDDAEVVYKEKLDDGSYQDAIFKSTSQIQYIFVDSSQKSITLKPIIGINNHLKNNDSDQYSVNLDVGYNIVPIIVVAEDKVTEGYYFFVIKRGAPSSDASIESIGVLNDGLILNKLSNDSYKVKIKHRTTELNLKIDLSDENAKYEIFGNDNLQDGDIVTIVVSAEDGTIATYTIEIMTPTMPADYFKLLFAFLIIIMTVIYLISLIKLRKKNYV